MRNLLMLTLLFIASMAFGYEFDQSSFKLEWTGFKTTNRVAVSGTFNEIKVTAPKNSVSDLKKFLESVAVTLNMKTVNSGNPVKDGNISNYFFGVLKKPEAVEGKLSGVVLSPDESKGTAVLDLKFNGKKGKVPVAFELVKQTLSTGEIFEFTMNGKIDLLAFNGKKAVESLNSACHDLHKGSDGVSKTWSEAEIKVTARVKR